MAATLSVDRLPTISYWLTVLFTFGVSAAIAFSPSVLKRPYLCAVLALLVPTDAEIFAVSEYAFWWGTLLAVVALLWNGRGHLVWRTVLTLIGGLSSPAIALFIPLFALRWLWQRSREDVVVLVAAVLSAAVQVVMVKMTAAQQPRPDFNLEPAVEKFFGLYASTWQPFTVGCLLIVTVAAFAIQQKRMPIVILIGLLGATIVASISRVPVATMHPLLAGPRYFFFPYIFLAWLLMQAAMDGQTWQRVVCTGLLVLGVYQFTERGQRRHMNFSWPQEMAACRADDEMHKVPIHYDGSKNLAWHVDLSGADCRKLKDRSLF
ncbi:hypothetical protein [Azospirillum sp. B4]|uniref:hypothetical protein n=1 Tax=Azospirillum sp. B4 TaxID=95605 RepID=UPI0011DC94AF|nr:hypothetical protein [Azospirillum sp. B4]